MIGELLLAKCIDVNIDGYGVSKLNGHIFCTPNLIPGELANVKVSHKKGSQWICELVEIVNESKNRRIPPCMIAHKCGGCSIQHISDEHQINIKYDSLVQVLRRLGNFKIDPEPIISSEHPFGYRNKTFIPIKSYTHNTLIMGYYQRGTHLICDLDCCPVLDIGINSLLPRLKEDLQLNGIIADPHSNKKGLIRHLGMRIGIRTGEVLITIVSTSLINELYNLARKWLREFDHCVGVTLNIQPISKNTILGNKTILLSGRDYLIEKFYGLTFQLKTTTFFQVNPYLAEKAVNIIYEWFKDKKEDLRIIDAYCGVGTISLPLSSLGFKVIGLELSHESIKQAKINSNINNITNTLFVEGDVAENLSRFLNSNDALILDPPRKGLNPTIIDTIIRIKPRKIAYLSCSQSTLTRDLSILCSAGTHYSIDRIVPIDFFPQTTHLEVLALVSLQSI